jgi:hypothetical protein
MTEEAGNPGNESLGRAVRERGAGRSEREYPLPNRSKEST